MAASYIIKSDPTTRYSMVITSSQELVGMVRTRRLLWLLLKGLEMNLEKREFYKFKKKRKSTKSVTISGRVVFHGFSGSRCDLAEPLSRSRSFGDATSNGRQKEAGNRTVEHSHRL